METPIKASAQTLPNPFCLLTGPGALHSMLFPQEMKAVSSSLMTIDFCVTIEPPPLIKIPRVRRRQCCLCFQVLILVECLEYGQTAWLVLPPGYNPTETRVERIPELSPHNATPHFSVPPASSNACSLPEISRGCSFLGKVRRESASLTLQSVTFIQATEAPCYF